MYRAKKDSSKSISQHRSKIDDIKPTRYYSKKQEIEVAKAINGTRTLNSGATMFSKGDIVADKFLIECKTA